MVQTKKAGFMSLTSYINTRVVNVRLSFPSCGMKHGIFLYSLFIHKILIQIYFATIHSFWQFSIKQELIGNGESTHICLLSCISCKNTSKFSQLCWIPCQWRWLMFCNAPSFCKIRSFFFLQVVATWTDSNSLDFFPFTVVIGKFVTILTIQSRDLPHEIKK